MLVTDKMIDAAMLAMGTAINDGEPPAENELKEFLSNKEARTVVGEALTAAYAVREGEDD